MIFFLAIPGIGAFAVRSRWRRFRRRITDASLLPLLDYGHMRRLQSETAEAARFRFLGSLEAIQGDQALWLRGGDVTVAADMSDSDIYVLPQYTGALPDEPPSRTTWGRLGSVPEGTKVFVSGVVSSDGAHAVMRGDRSEPLLVVLYDGPERDLLRRSIWSGRQLNEYWNQLTPGALAGGILALIIVAYVLLRGADGRLPALFALSLASLPLLPLLPPGVALFFLYRWSWRRGRMLRAHRDILRLPLRHLADPRSEGALPDGEPYGVRLVARERLTMLSEGAVTLSPPIEVAAAEYSVFGHPGPDGPEPPGDPMTELVAVPGDPVELSERCQRRARRFELLSGAILVAGLVINLIWVFAAFQYLVR
jgi:hypothetical protein